MSLPRLPLVAVSVFALLGAAPAAALSGYPLIGGLHPATLTVAKSKESKHTCQAGRDQTRAAVKTTAADRHTIPPVACEQPPRSQIVLPGLKQATASALALFG
jgi:hypothetical protein